MSKVGRRTVIAGLAGGAFLLLAGCQKPEEHVPGRAAPLPYTGARPGAPAATLPSFVTAEVKDGYEFALERPDLLRVLPCYCGCGLTAGHRSNLDCFIAGAGPDGAAVFDEHASFCQTCLDIARDAKALIAQGKSLPAIRSYVDARHGDKGPPTDTPLPPDPDAKGG